MSDAETAVSKLEQGLPDDLAARRRVVLIALLDEHGCGATGAKLRGLATLKR